MEIRKTACMLGLMTLSFSSFSMAWSDKSVVNRQVQVHCPAPKDIKYDPQGHHFNEAHSLANDNRVASGWPMLWWSYKYAPPNDDEEETEVSEFEKVVLIPATNGRREGAITCTYRTKTGHRVDFFMSNHFDELPDTTFIEKGTEQGDGGVWHVYGRTGVAAMCNAGVNECIFSVVNGIASP